MLYVLTTIYLLYLGIREVGVHSDNKTGPNNTSGRVVWAISKFFFTFLYIIYANYLFLGPVDTRLRGRMGGDDENRPK